MVPTVVQVLALRDNPNIEDAIRMGFLQLNWLEMSATIVVPTGFGTTSDREITAILALGTQIATRLDSMDGWLWSIKL